MPFKSERFWSGSRASGLHAGSRAAIGAALALALLSSQAHATVTAVVQQGGNTQGPTGPSGTTFYFAGQAATTRGAPVLTGCAPAGSGAPAGSQLAGCATFFYPGYSALDLGASAAAGGDVNNGNWITFLLTSTLGTSTPTGQTGSSYEVVATVYPPGGSGSREYIPIAAVGGQPCYAAGCYTLGTNLYYRGSASYGLEYFAAPFNAGSTMTVSLYPADICYTTESGQIPNSGGAAPVAPLGCASVSSSFTGYTVNPIIDGGATTSTTPQLTVEFDIYAMTSNSPTGGPNQPVSGTPADTGTGYVLNFQGDTPAMVPGLNCPGIDTSYTPGDGAVNIITNYFAFDIASSGTAVPSDPNHAPPAYLVIASKHGPQFSPPDLQALIGTTPTEASAQQALADNEDLSATGGNPLVPYGGTNPITGFQNVSSSNQTDANSYQLQIMVMDATGMVAVPLDGTGGNGSGGSNPGCSLIDVQSTAIQGFLAKSSCFIATGAFRSGDAAPVLLLRAFRDQVLLHSAFGKAFVHWYYGWSPPAALWLLGHPIFRFPVLLALVPLEALAWLALHPAILLALLAVALGLCAGALARENSARNTVRRPR